MRSKVKSKKSKTAFSASLRLCGILLLFTLGVLAQNDGSEQNVTGKPGTFAIVGARIVTVSGAVIENGTVVIQNGKIAAVGANVSVPSGAEKIDGKGLSVFPGMIDAATNLGWLRYHSASTPRSMLPRSAI